MSKEKYVLVVDHHDFISGHDRNNHSYYKPFEKYGTCTTDLNRLKTDPESIVFAVFTGGEDVSPYVYKESTNPRTYANANRDAFEIKAFNLIRKSGIRCFGICRGAQLLCALSGGRLAQHVDNHSGANHPIKTIDGQTFYVTSSHHQMQIPPKDAVLLGWAEPRRTTTRQDGNEEEINIDADVECVYYPSTDSIGFQYHPEWMNEESEGFKYCSYAINKFWGI